MTARRLRAALFFCLLTISHVCLSGDNVWTSNGPFTGSLDGFVFHTGNPNIVFATAPYFIKSVFRSVTAGKTWKRLDLLDCCTKLVLHPLDPDRLLGIEDSFVYESRNQGNTWKVLSIPAGSTLVDIELDPFNTEIYYVLVSREGIMKSTDSGATWAFANQGLPAANTVFEITIDPTQGQILYAHDDDGLFKTTDGAKTWKILNKTDNVSRLVVHPGNSETLFGIGFASDDIYKSTNAGVSWNTTNCDCSPTGISIDPKNPSVIYGASVEGVVKSTNTGRTWRRLFLPFTTNRHDTTLTVVAPHPKINLLLAGGFELAGVYRSVNGGASWGLVRNKLDQLFFTDVEINPRKPQQLLAFNITFGGYLFRSESSGKSWSLITSLASKAVNAVKIHPKNENLFVAVLNPPLSIFREPTSVAVSTNAGKTWAVRESPGPFFGFATLALDPLDTNTIYLGLSGFAKSTDLGRTWKRMEVGLSNPAVEQIVFDPADPSNIIVSTGGGFLFESKNSGSSWQKISSFFSNKEMTHLLSDPQTADILYAAVPGSIFKSSNRGKTWKAKNAGLPRIKNSISQLLAIDPLNGNTLYTGGVFTDDPNDDVGTRGLLFISTDGANRWSPFDLKGLGSFAFNDLDISPVSSDQLFLGTARGVFSFQRSGSSTEPQTPVIQQLSALSGKIGETITIQGRNFGPAQGKSKVSFGSIVAGTARLWSDTEIRMAVPPAAQTGPLTVTVGTKKSNSLEFVAVPSDGQLLPVSGAPGTRVALVVPGVTGSSFNVLFGIEVAQNLRPVEKDVYLCTAPPGKGRVEVKLLGGFAEIALGEFQYTNSDLTLTDAAGLHLMNVRKIKICSSTDFSLSLTGVPLVIHPY